MQKQNKVDKQIVYNEYKNYSDMTKKDNLATQYWYKILELEKTLNQALSENQQLKERISIVEKENMELRIENENLKKMIFKGGKPSKKNDNSFVSLIKETRLPAQRTSASYRRKIPELNEITDFKEYPAPFEKCPDCGHNLKFIKIIERFIEDIPAFYEVLSKIIKKENIHCYQCTKCKKKVYGKNNFNLQGQKVLLGENVKMFVLYLINIMNLSFNNAINIIYDIYKLKISDGDITNILQNSSTKLQTEHFNIRAKIKNSKTIHMDETGWKKLLDKYYVWIMTPSNSKEVSFEIANTRGKGVCANMLGKDLNKETVLNTDFYRGYDNFPCRKQKCWVHLIRDFENLAKNDSVPKKLRTNAYNRYSKICEIYTELKVELEKPFQIEDRQLALNKFKEKLKLFSKITKSDAKLKKLKNLKIRILNYLDELLTCLIVEGVPTNNNTAEQRLRRVVIKRKISFGSRSDESAKSLAINLSVLLTLWNSTRDSFFPDLKKLLTNNL